MVVAIEATFRLVEATVDPVDPDRAPVEGTVDLLEGTPPPDGAPVTAGEPGTRPRRGNGAAAEATSRPVKGNANCVEGKAIRVEGEAIRRRDLARPYAVHVAVVVDEGWGRRGNVESVDGSAFPESGARCAYPIPIRLAIRSPLRYLTKDAS